MKNTHKKATAALIIGILSLILWIIPLFGLPLSIIGIVLSIKGITRTQKYALAALICAIIGLALTSANGAVGAYTGITGQNALVNSMFQK